MTTCTTIEEYLERAHNFDPIAQLIVDFGRSWQPAKLPIHVEKGQLGECFLQARALALTRPERFTYVEGYACEEIFFPVRHAWCADRQGRVVDPTWRFPELGQFWGIALNAGALQQEGAAADHGLLGSPTFFRRFIKDPGRYLKSRPLR